MEITKYTSRPRIQYLDTTKGILMLCLLYGHMKFYSNSIGVNDVILKAINATIGLYVCFFMQTFFIITGFCSTFSIPFRDYLRRNIKTLVMPAFFLTTINFIVVACQCDCSWWNGFMQSIQTLPSWLSDGGPWFIICLFWAKILFWFILKIKSKYQIAIMTTLYFLALWLNENEPIPNYQWHRHVFLFLPYLAFGYYLKSYKERINNDLAKWAFFGGALILLENVLYHTPFFVLPWCDANININFYNFPIHVITAVSGSATVVYVAKRLSEVAILAKLGGGSLLIYLLNSAVHVPIIRLLKPLHNSDSIIGCLSFHLTSYALCVMVMFILIRLVYKKKWLSWLVGKW